MPRLRIPRAIRSQILPEDRIPLDWLKRYPFFLRLRIALDEPTPLFIQRLAEAREVGAAASAVSFEIDHEGADPICTLPVTRPIVVVPVVTRHVVALRPHALDVQEGPPALESARTLLKTSHHVVAVQQRTVGQSDRWVHALGHAVVDDGGSISIFTVIELKNQFYHPSQLYILQDTLWLVFREIKSRVNLPHFRQMIRLRLTQEILNVYH